MPLIVEYSPRARADLLDIFEYIHGDNPNAARRMVTVINRTCETIISDNPLIGRQRDNLQSKLRSFAVRPYVIFYVPTDTSIDIIRVLHGARDIDAVFSK